MYLSSSKVAIAVGGNFAFAMALCLYKVTVKVRCGRMFSDVSSENMSR